MLALLAATWKRLLLLSLLALLPLAAVFGAISGIVHTGLINPVAAGPMSRLFSELSSAWAWSASLFVLQAAVSGEQLTTLAAVRAAVLDWRQILKLWFGFVLLALPSAALTVYVAVSLDFGLATRLLSGPWAEAAHLYVSFAFSMLAAAVLIERRWLGRALKLSHFSVRTAGMIVVWLAISFVIYRLLELASFAGPIPGAVVYLATGVVEAVVIYAIYMRVRAQEAGHEQAPAQPVVL